MVSEGDPQECIIVRGDDQDFDAQFPETLCAKIQPGQSSTGKTPFLLIEWFCNSLDSLDGSL